MRPIDLLFVVGCPRSGTTWLQLLLSQHPSIATTIETHLFPRYLSPMLRSWNKEKQGGSLVGLAPLIEESDFLELCRAFLRNLADVALRDKPSATLYLEKTPGHALYAQHILQLFPGAWFVHIVRDPRAVVASILAAHAEWGGSLDYRPTRAAAQQWAHSVLTAHKISTLTHRFTEVRYEDLRNDTENVLRNIVQMLPVETSEDFYSRAIEVCSALALSKGGRDTWPSESLRGTLSRVARNATTDSWRAELCSDDVTRVEWEVRHVMPRFGYDFELINPKVPPLLLLRDELFARLSSWYRKPIRRS